MQSEDIHPSAPSNVEVIAYAPSSLKSRLTLSQYVAIAIFAIGAVLYSIACIPSYSHSSWPPIDRLWEAIPWLWVFPIPMFTLVMPGGSFSRKILVLYALLTSGIDAWTFPFVNMHPHPTFDLDLWFNNLIMTVPIHLALTSVISLLSRLAYFLFHISAPFGTMPQSRTCHRARVALFAGIPVIAAIFPVTYRYLALVEDTATGANMADADWTSRKASIISNDVASYRQISGIGFVSFFDADSGFPLKQSWFRRWEPRYNAEIRNLIKNRGTPAWSLKNRFVDDADMVNMLTATDMKEITFYPYNLSPNIVLFRGGGVTPWGTNIGSNSKYLDIQSRNQDSLPIGLLGEETAPAFVGQLPKYPGTYFVRCGKSVVACTVDGWILQYVSDDR